MLSDYETEQNDLINSTASLRTEFLTGIIGGIWGRISGLKEFLANPIGATKETIDSDEKYN